MTYYWQYYTVQKHLASRSDGLKTDQDSIRFHMALTGNVYEVPMQAIIQLKRPGITVLASTTQHKRSLFLRLN